jgi:ABC-type nitrate/sulfonate/bicarbonate transport system substrate-binding protein
MTDKAPFQLLRFGLVSKTFYYTPVWVAIEKGMFADVGLEVELSYLGSDVQIESLLQDKLDITIAPPEGIIQNAFAGGPLRIIGGNSGKLSHWLMARPEIKAIEDLRGRTFGILNKTEGSFFHFQVLAEKHGLFYPGDYEIAATGGAPARHRALIAGTLDAGLQSIPWCFLGEDMGLNKLADISDYVPDWQFNTINANQSWCRRNEQVVVATLVAIQRAVRWIYGNRDESAEIAARSMEIEPRYAQRAWDYFTSLEKLTRDMRVNTSGLETVIDSQIRAGLLLPQGRGDLQRYIDQTWLDSAQRRLE